MHSLAHDYPTSATSLMDEAIDVHPDALSRDELRERAWQVVLPHYLQRLAGLVESFDPRSVAEAAVAGRVATLLVEAERLLPGRVDASSGEITAADLAHPEVDDVFGDLGELVLNRRPTDSGAAAIYRF